MEPWTTTHEKQYIDDLLSPIFWRTVPHKLKRRPDQLIRNHMANIRKREKYGTLGDIDAKEILKYDKIRLKKIEKRMKK